jgi:hypothetical protein
MLGGVTMPEGKPNYMGIVIVGGLAVGAYLAYRYFSQSQDTTSSGTGSSGGGSSGGGSQETPVSPIDPTSPSGSSIPESKTPGYVFTQDSKGNLIIPTTYDPTEAAAFMQATLQFVNDNATIRPYLGTNDIGQNVITNLNQVSATDPLRFARNPTTGAVIDKYELQSITPSEFIKRSSQAQARTTSASGGVMPTPQADVYGYQKELELAKNMSVGKMVTVGTGSQVPTTGKYSDVFTGIPQSRNVQQSLSYNYREAISGSRSVAQSQSIPQVTQNKNVIKSNQTTTSPKVQQMTRKAQNVQGTTYYNQKGQAESTPMGRLYRGGRY